MPTTKTCICCGFTSDVPQHFKRGKYAARCLRDFEQSWVCKSDIKCMGRTEYGSDLHKR